MRNFETVINGIIDILNIGVVLAIALSIVVFFYGIVIYIAQSGDEGKRKEGVQYIFYGIIGIFVMVSVWAIVGLLTGTFGISVGIPQF